MANIRRDYSGNKYGHLTMLLYSKPGGTGMGAIWKARCDCGNIVDVIAKEAARGNIKTCGKCELKHKTRLESIRKTRQVTGALTRLYSKFLIACHKSAVHNELTEEQYLNIVARKCTYCEQSPDTSLPQSKILVNHVDRLRLDGHYHLTNVCSICSSCRGWKNGKDSTNFIEKVLQVADSIRKRAG